MPIGKFDETYGANPAENYEQYFVPVIGEPMARDLLGRASLRPTDRVLDVACGTGIVARLAVETVADTGSAAGLDPNTAMLAVARAARNGARVEWHEAPAEQMPVPDSAFDVVLCQMGLQFMTDRLRAMREMRRVLQNGGRVLVSVPGPITGIFLTLAAALERHIGTAAGGFVRQVFSLHERGEVESLLREAGFRNSLVETTTQTLRLPAPRQFLWEYIHCTPLAGVVSAADADTKVALEKDVVAACGDVPAGEGAIQQQGVTVALGYVGAAV